MWFCEIERNIKYVKHSDALFFSKKYILKQDYTCIEPEFLFYFFKKNFCQKYSKWMNFPINSSWRFFFSFKI